MSLVAIVAELLAEIFQAFFRWISTGREYVKNEVETTVLEAQEPSTTPLR